MNSKEVREQDRAVAELAKYAATSGGTRQASRMDVLVLFSEYKLLLMKGEADIKSLTESIYRRYGDPSWDGSVFPGIRETVPSDLQFMPKAEIC